MKKLMAVTLGAVMFALVGLAHAEVQLSEIRTLFLAYEADQDIEGCESAVREALGAEGIVTAADEAASDAVLKVKMAVNQGGLRPSMNWGAAILTKDGSRLFTDAGEESGWSLKLACEDLASDLAEEIADDMSQARLIGF